MTSFSTHCAGLSLSALAITFVSTVAHAEGDAAHGRQLYAARCAACHSLEYNGVGPTHKGVVGRRAGTAPGYVYSNALKNSNVVWGEDSLSRWLADPDKFIPGQKMFISIPDSQERADLVAYLLQAGRQQPLNPTTNGASK